MPCQSIPVNGKLLAGCGKKKPSGEPGTPVSQGKEIRAGEYNGRTVSFRLPDKRRGTLSGGTDGRVPFVLPPRCPVSAMQPAGVVGSGRRDGTTRAPRCKRKTVKTLSPTLGIAGESPTRRGTPKQPPAKTAFEHTIEKKEDRIFRSFALMIYICN